MKKLFTIILIAFCGTNLLHGQLSFSKSNLEQFKNTKTYIVLEDNMFSECNANIKKAAELYWKITPYEIIGQSEFAKLCNQESNASFLTLVNGTYSLGKNTLEVNLLTLVIGDKSGKIDKMREVISIPLATFDEDGESNSYGYKLAGIIKAMHYMLDTLAQIDISPNDLKMFLRANRHDILQQTLLLTPDDVSSDINTADKLKKVYPYKFAFVEENKIEEAIYKNENKAFVHHIGELGNWSMFVIISCENGRLLYGNYKQAKDSKLLGVTKDDFLIIQ